MKLLRDLETIENACPASLAEGSLTAAAQFEEPQLNHASHRDL